MLTVHSHPAQHVGFVKSVIDSFATRATVTDKTYATIFIAALAASVLILCTSYSISRDPIFPKNTLKLPRFRRRGYDLLAQFSENGNGVARKDRKTNPEPLKGWRFRMGLLLNFVLIALVAIHTVILVFSGPTLLRIVFVVYWVATFNVLDTDEQGLVLAYNSFRFLPTLYRRSLYNLVCGLGVIPLTYHLHVDVLPRLVLRSRVPIVLQSETPEWEFITVITLTFVANIIPYSPLQL